MSDHDAEAALTDEGRAVLEAIRTSAEQQLVRGLNAVSLAAWIVHRIPRNGYEVRAIHQAAEAADREAAGGVRALSGATSAAADPAALKRYDKHTWGQLEAALVAYARMEAPWAPVQKALRDRDAYHAKAARLAVSEVSRGEIGVEHPSEDSK